MKVFAGLAMFALGLTLSFARSPAVLPVTGLSIEEAQQPVEHGPEKIGYDFSAGASKQVAMDPASEIKALMAAGAAFTVLVPFIYVFFFRNRHQKAAVDIQTVANNVTALPVNNNKKSEEKIRKAS